MKIVNPTNTNNVISSSDTNTTINIINPTNTSINLCYPTNSTINIFNPTNVSISICNSTDSTMCIVNPTNTTITVTSYPTMSIPTDTSNSIRIVSNSVINVIITTSTVSIPYDSSTVPPSDATVNKNETGIFVDCYLLTA